MKSAQPISRRLCRSLVKKADNGIVAAVRAPPTAFILIPSDCAATPAARSIARSIGVSEPNSTAARRRLGTASLRTPSSTASDRKDSTGGGLLRRGFQLADG